MSDPHPTSLTPEPASPRPDGISTPAPKAPPVAADQSPGWVGPLLGLIFIPLGIGAAFYGLMHLFGNRSTPANPIAQLVLADERPPGEEGRAEDRKPERLTAPELEGGTAWLNTAGPLRMKDLRGKIVLLDFWTLCCINCIHTLPDLAALEKKYANELVVIGVHTPKFDNEKSTESIRKAILRYEVTHPVVNDAEHRIWDTYGPHGWPTLVLIDPEGGLVYARSGEGQFPLLDQLIARVIKVHKEKKTLNEKPLKFQLARVQENGQSPLFFPGKVAADEKGKRLFIADSTHHRIVITDLGGKKIAVAGSGRPGSKNGSFEEASFYDPQGLAFKGELVYVADRKNHLIRMLDLKARTVKTLAGLGVQGSDRDLGGPAREVGLNSPWDLLLDGHRLFIAMAGHHQIWVLDLDSHILKPFAGSGRERIRDGSLLSACFAQPSGLTSDGTNLYVADSEVSGIRAIPLDGRGEVRTLVGKGLFDFGDVDGTGEQVRLQHALGVVWHQGKLYIADTYNSKIKVLDPDTQKCKTFLGGEPEGWLAASVFSEPGGISYANGKLYVADTNAHRIRVVDIAGRSVSTLKLEGVEPPREMAEAKRAGGKAAE
jgi:DNA-binding beta-propeller fold protein YncE